ncbi:hypothetical protein [Sphingobacterium faecale]|uniref:DUF4465 domain-containing protein n=1 Tax=Sphingobacterium faecale TaxID=2803775 RepID=A0ABS1RA97_9SPHI|nr:hypothetical protein [Sphingobacterium faecale]MBL1411465.1 hypothetical protein [Sphingobacterium faecale]
MTRHLTICSIIMGMLLLSCKKDKALTPPSTDYIKYKEDDSPQDQLHESLKGSNYVLLFLDDATAEKIKGKILKDYRPNKSNGIRNAIWNGLTNKSESTMGQNFYGVGDHWMWYDVNEGAGWSVLAWHTTANEAFDFTEIDQSYTLHIAMKSVDNESHGFRFYKPNSDASVYEKFGFTIGENMMTGESVEDYRTNIPRDGKWHEIEIKLSDLGNKWNYNQICERTSVEGSENLLTILSGGKGGTTLQIDAIFFYKKGV